MTPRNDTFLEKPPPSSEESERVILGSVLLDNDLMQQVAESLEAEDFYSSFHRRVFAGMLTLHRNSRAIEPTLIGEELKKESSLESVGGITTIANLSFGMPHLSNLSEYINTVRGKSYLRKLVRECSAIQSKVLAEEEDVKDLLDDAQAKINDLCMSAETGQDTHFASLDRIIDNEVIQALEDLRYGRSTRIKTAFPFIDNAVGGLSLSDVLLVAADTGNGKSAFALQMAYQIAKQGVPTAFLAGEMTNKENVLRLLSQLSGITNLNSLTHISDSEYQFLVEWAMSIRNAPIKFEHRISDMQTLRTHLRSIVRRHKVQVLVIDYIQLFKMEKLDRRKRNERIAECSQEVKRLANELGIAIIEVAQFNREGAKSGKPSLHDLEGSGQLEKDASMIFILELGEVELRDEQNKSFVDASIRIVKGRNVGKSEIPGKFYGRSVQFEFGG